MLILALDTTTRAGSIALMRDEALLAAETGDPGRTHGVRLPADIVQLLARHEIPLAAIDLFAVAAGPGSFTGLRIGIATMQGFAVANGKGLVGVSALDALALSAQGRIREDAGDASGAIAVWMDAQRQEVFAAIYDAADRKSLDGPAVGSPAEILARWRVCLDHDRVWFVGDGALAYRAIISNGRGGVTLIDPTPLMAPAVAMLAAQEAKRGEVRGPDAVRPLYVRRPDAELARDRANVRNAASGMGRRGPISEPPHGGRGPTTKVDR
jgi:tRNA threonylcarbamoyladenosine biosynthesis protein TsaB